MGAIDAFWRSPCYLAYAFNFSPVFAASTSASQLSSEVLLRATALFSQWENARPVGSIPLSSEFRNAYDQFVAEVLSDSQETNLGIADVEEVLCMATNLAVGRAEASGPGRALRALHEANQNAQATGPRTSTQGRIILLIQSRPDAELEMDELTNVTENLLRNVGPEWEMIFGYGIVPNLPAEFRLTFLLAPVAGTANS